MDADDTPARSAASAPLALPRPQGLDDARLSEWCDQLLDRVEPGGLSAAPRESPQGDIAGRYRLLHRIGEGGVGELWCAEHTAIGKRFALKLLRADLSGDPVIVKRFIREGQLASAAEHPGIVSVTDVGQTETGRPYLVMELLEGCTLTEVVRRDGPLRWPRARALLEQLARALASAHERGIIHRDLKPSNVMVVEQSQPPQERCTIIDFGLSKQRLLSEEHTALTHTGQVFGSPAYMSPEQFRGEPADERSDVYSLGCIAYFLLHGTRPFDGQAPATLMYQHLMEPLPAVTIDDGPPRAAIERLLRTACAKKPAERFATMAQLLAALQAIDDAPPRRRIRWALVGPGLAAAGVLTAAFALRGPEAVSNETSASASALTDSPTPIAPGDTVVDVQAGETSTCVLTASGQVRCWGLGSAVLCRPDESPQLDETRLPHTIAPLDFGPQRKATQIALDLFSEHACALFDDQTVRCWGADDKGQLGLGSGVHGWCGDEAQRLARLPPLPIPTVEHITVQASNTCALRSDTSQRRSLYCWGDNSHGQLGRGDMEQLQQPPVWPIDLGAATVREFAMGVHHVCALLGDGAVRCWGGNGYLQLGNDLGSSFYLGDGIGDGHRGQRPTDAELDVLGLDDFRVAAIRINGGWSCVLGDDGRVRCWGASSRGNLGVPLRETQSCWLPEHQQSCIARPDRDIDLGDLGGARVVDLQLGRLRACILDDRGAVRCWGWGTAGGLGYGPQLREATGHDNIGDMLTPAQAWHAMGNDGVVDVGDLDGDGAIDRVVQLAMGHSHTCVRVDDGSVRCWGANTNGQLGYGTTDDIGDDETPGDYYREHGCGAVPVFSGPGC